MPGRRKKAGQIRIKGLNSISLDFSRDSLIHQYLPVIAQKGEILREGFSVLAVKINTLEIFNS